ncbi:hypothetical protein [Brevibacillus laterosporus]|uniref:hypothetical protein n=1 Tax=Brevibacillus laterosporus TaxID=1465 RepID=UPI000EB1E282|nr:hypothetical protein [Brevibacillus laterosporus]AYK08830.1 hypothetical protein D8Z77_22160 [Brevibacillus laterosporus]
MGKFGKLLLISILLGTTFILFYYFYSKSKVDEWVGIEVNDWLDQKLSDPIYSQFVLSFTVDGANANKLNVIASEEVAEYGIYLKERVFRNDLWVDFCEKRNINLQYHKKKEDMYPVDCVVNISTKKGDIQVDNNLIVDVDGTRYHRHFGGLYTSNGLIESQRRAHEIEKNKAILSHHDCGNRARFGSLAYDTCVKAFEREKKEKLKEYRINVK